MYLHEWREGEEARIGKKVSLKNMANKFGISDGSVVRRWMLPAYDKGFNFPDYTTILNIKNETFGEVSPEDWYRWLEETKTEPKIEKEKIDIEEFQENYLPEEEKEEKRRFENHYLVDVKEASLYLFGSDDRAHQQKVRRLAKNGALKHIRSGKRFYFNREILHTIGS